MRAANQAERLSKFKQGEGYFVYLGGACDTEAIPGVPLMGKDGHQVTTVPLITVQDENGQPVTVADPKGGGKAKPVWKKAPEFRRTEIKVYKFRLPGVDAEWSDEAKSFVPKLGADGKAPQLWLEMPIGKVVFVSDPTLALKLRRMKFFKEVDGEEKPAPKKGQADKPAA